MMVTPHCACEVLSEEVVLSKKELLIAEASLFPVLPVVRGLCAAWAMTWVGSGMALLKFGFGAPERGVPGPSNRKRWMISKAVSPGSLICPLFGLAGLNDPPGLLTAGLSIRPNS